MDGAQLRSAFESWLSVHPSLRSRVSFNSSEPDLLSFLLDNILITLNFSALSVEHTSDKPFMDDWTDLVEAMLADDHAVGEQHMREVLNELVQKYDEFDWGSSAEEEEDFVEMPEPEIERFIGMKIDEEEQDHFVFRDAVAAQQFLESSNLANAMNILCRPEKPFVRLRISLPSLNFPPSSCELLSILSDERIMITLTYRPSLLSATRSLGWVEGLFNEVDLVCTTEAEVLSDVSLYFPGVVKLFLDRMADKYQRERERDSAMGVSDVEMSLMSMGFNLKHVRFALKKAKSSGELALEKLIKWGSSYDWVQTDNSNPYINLCLSLQVFFSRHQLYCKHCYIRHSAPSNVLHYCHKNSCVIDARMSDNLVTLQLQENYHGVRLDLSFLVAAYTKLQLSQQRVKVVGWQQLISLTQQTRTLKALRHIRSDAELCNVLCPENYNTLRRIVLTCGLRVRKRKLSETTLASLFKLTDYKNVKVYEVMDTASSEFAAAKVEFGSSLRLYSGDTNNWYCVTRLGMYKPVEVLGRYVRDGMWATDSMTTVLAYSRYAEPLTEWSYSLLNGRRAVAVVEVVERPQYKVGDLYIVTKKEDFVIRYWLVVDGAGQAAYTVVAEFGTAPRDYGTVHAGWNQVGPSQSGHSLYSGPPGPPYMHPRPISFVPLLPQPYEGPPAHSPQQTLWETGTSSEVRTVNEAELPPELKDVYSAMKPKFCVSQTKTAERLLFEFMELLTKPAPRIQVRLRDDSDTFIWLATIFLTDLSLPAEFLSGIRSIDVKLVFNSFFPLLPPFVTIVRPVFNSSVVTLEGFIFRPPMWNATSTVREHLVRIVKHLAEAGSRVIG